MKWLLVCLLACSAKQRARPAALANDLYFPVGVVADGRYAYVVNANTDLVFASGWVAKVDLDAVATLTPDDDPFNQKAFVADAMVPVGAFGGFALQYRRRLLVPTREDGVIFSIPLDGGEVLTGTPAGDLPEPFALAVTEQGVIFATNLTGKVITTFNESLAEVGHFEIESEGTRSVVAVKNQVYMSPRVAQSRGTTLLQYVDASGTEGSIAFPDGAAEVSTVVGDSTRLVVLLNDPNAIVTVDPAQNMMTGRIDLPFTPGPAAVSGDQLFVGSKDDGAIYLVDLAAASVAASFTTGDSADGSPGAIAIAGSRLLATYFKNDALAVFDIDSHTLLGRVGSPRRAK